MKLVLLSAIHVSLNGFSVETFEAGEYEELPEIAIEHAKNIGVLEGAEKTPTEPEKKKASGKTK